ncbi:ABC transporter permease [Nocardioides panzhihuensis]|uniref:NitT/TauT family transport system permease protein n=1 Tax=Nocardioides panzhihuensis TaxID=860243 RepID=A0A7Z0DHY7_9ACTN|nr:ABC transporter permease [Nocardioides panzhihuensis]NYI75941.1 NitT/TauT family transport system permease protein [Nocardioides panzhihuensis]
MSLQPGAQTGTQPSPPRRPHLLVPTPEQLAARRLRRRTRLLRPAYWLPFVLLVVVLAVAWGIGARQMPYLFVPLGEIAGVLSEDPAYFLENTLITLGEAMVGLGIGFVAAFALAVVVSEVAVVRRAVMPLAVVLSVTPLVAIAPLLVVALGFGMAPKVVLTALVCFFPILINVATGLRTVPGPVLEVYRTVAASRLEVLRHLRVPASLPYVFASLRIVFPLSMIGAVVAELAAAGSADGLGSVIQVASSQNRLATVWAAIFVLAALGSLLFWFVTLAERRVLRWHQP